METVKTCGAAVSAHGSFGGEHLLSARPAQDPRPPTLASLGGSRPPVAFGRRAAQREAPLRPAEGSGTCGGSRSSATGLRRSPSPGAARSAAARRRAGRAAAGAPATLARLRSTLGAGAGA
jgi:hypothetical protein